MSFRLARGCFLFFSSLTRCPSLFDSKISSPAFFRRFSAVPALVARRPSLVLGRLRTAFCPDAEMSFLIGSRPSPAAPFPVSRRLAFSSAPDSAAVLIPRKDSASVLDDRLSAGAVPDWRARAFLRSLLVLFFFSLLLEAS